jgi:cbb3-type cytochrome oxidase maturation protein
MFIDFWIGWALVGLAAATWLFAWSVKKGQFEESRRAALLPLDDLESRPPGNRRGRLHLAVLLGVATLGVLLTGITVVLAVMPR